MQPDTVIKTNFGTIKIYDKGRHVEYDIDSSIKENRHHKELEKYVDKLLNEGVDRINCDHINVPGLDRNLKLARGKRKLDIVYYKDGRIHEIEMKTKPEVGLERTAQQLIEQSKLCENLILLVPSSEINNAEEIIRLRRINKVTVDTYE